MRRFLVVVCLAVSCALAAGSVIAADEHDHNAGKAAHAPVKLIAHEHDIDGKENEVKYDLSVPDQKKKFFEQIENGHITEVKQDVPPQIIPKRWDTGVWSVVIFVVLFLLLSKFAWKPMLQGLKKREDNIRGALEQAEKTRREAMELQSQLDAKMHAAGAEIAKMMDEGRRDAQGLKDQLVADAKAEIQKERDRLVREVGLAKDQALSEIWQQSVALATSMSAKAVRRGLSEEDHRRLLDESLAELKQAGTGYGRRA